MSNYATKKDLKNATGFDTSSFSKNNDLANLKSDVDKLDKDQLENVTNNFSNLKNKVEKLDVDKLVPVPVDLCKLSDVVKSNLVKKDVCNPNIKNIENKTHVTILATNTNLNAKINEMKNEIPSITNLATTVALTTP